MFGQRFLVIYSGVLTAAFAVSMLAGFSRSSIATFDEINVHRINVREPDGTLRMVISDSAKLPGVIVKGKEQPKVDRPQAGMIFFNDEGSENGGLIFGGKRDTHGDVVDSGGSLSFDAITRTRWCSFWESMIKKTAWQEWPCRIARNTAMDIGVSGWEGRETVQRGCR